MSSYKYSNVYLKDWSLLVGPLENDSKLKKYDLKMNDYYYGEKTFEQAEIKMQREVINNLLNKNNLLNSDIDLIIGGDLTDQISVTNSTCIDNDISLLGIYSACATFPESLIIASEFIGNKNAKILTITSGHNLTVERQFRYPIEYGAPRKKTSTFTTTASVSTLIGKNSGKIKIESSTIGKVCEMGISDVNNMGAIMAPAAAKTLHEHLRDLKREVDYYDLILTGDLGCYGKELFKELCYKNYGIKLKKYLDAGCELYLNSQDVFAGGSGPACLPTVLFGKILSTNKYKKILIIGTGSLHNKTLTNQKLPVPAISHAVGLEVL